MVLKLVVLLVVKRPLAVAEKQKVTHGNSTCDVRRSKWYNQLGEWTSFGTRNKLRLNFASSNIQLPCSHIIYYLSSSAFLPSESLHATLACTYIFSFLFSGAAPCIICPDEDNVPPIHPLWTAQPSPMVS